MTEPHRRRAASQQGEARLWQVEAFGGLELLRANSVEFNFSPHAHKEYMIAVTGGGLGLPRYRGGGHRVGPGDLLVLNPGEVHGGGTDGKWSWRYRAFYPPATLMKRIARELTGIDRGFPQFTQDVVKDSSVAAMLHGAHDILEKPGSASTIFAACFAMKPAYRHTVIRCFGASTSPRICWQRAFPSPR